jgi:hypothetical protein
VADPLLACHEQCSGEETWPFPHNIPRGWKPIGEPCDVHAIGIDVKLADEAIQEIGDLLQTLTRPSVISSDTCRPDHNRWLGDLLSVRGEIL